MAINFDSLPKDKPNSSTVVVEGTAKATIFKAEMVANKDNTSKYLRVTFKTEDGAFVSENYFDSDKSFPQYKISRLLTATNIKLEGTGSLEDIAKLIKNKEVIIDVTKNDRGYGTLDYSNDKEGIYPVTESNTVEVIDEDIAEAVADDEF